MANSTIRAAHAVLGGPVLALLALLAWAPAAQAADPCPRLRGQQSDPGVATRIAAIACDEHVRWQRPFIDAAGRVAHQPAYEAESGGLSDGGSPWRRVAMYWRSAGLLGQVGYRAGATDCGFLSNPSYPGLACRGFVVDTPWSGTFVSWVMQRAGVPRFQASSGHFDYVRAARVAAAGSPYLFLDPMTVAPGVGDLLCYVRTGKVHGHRGLVAAIDGGASALAMHCDVVVGVNPGNDASAWLVGGNVQQAVTMRRLPLNATGRFWNLPLRADGEAECSPDLPAACNFNRQDWAVLLKLKPQQELAKLGPVAPPALAPLDAPAQTCCMNCVLGSDVPRCPPAGSVPPARDDAD
jgi:hypothetical protein